VLNVIAEDFIKPVPKINEYQAKPCRVLLMDAF